MFINLDAIFRIYVNGVFSISHGVQLLLYHQAGCYPKAHFKTHVDWISDGRNKVLNLVSIANFVQKKTLCMISKILTCAVSEKSHFVEY